ncbi:MAG TPA: tetratricopeptide repeat protein, partial [Candidatus Aminicenantes bacterium]|nr:tetratricopeptide repeat protein [Candidatus Aminicenantes bacterium]
LLFVRKEYGEAEKILLEALAVADGDYRTLTNLVRVYRELKRPETSMEMLGRIIKKRGPRTDLLSLMALLHSEQGDWDRAAEIYGRILAEDPGNYDIRARLGIIEIERDRPDEALEIFDPLVSHFLQKSDEDKAAGLLGLILMSGRMHLPTLERLAGVFRGVGRTKDLEVVLRVLLAEYRSESRDNDRIRILRELYILLPMDAGIAEEAETLGIRRELHQEAAEVAPEAGRPISEQDQEMLRLNLAKAELYLEQGLVRNARRILENLRLLYPDDPRIQKKIESLRAAPSVVGEEEIPEIVEETARREIDIIGPAVEPGMVVPPISAPPLDLESLISDFAQ